jgi:Bacterial capsule synthesis protein PGA_cap
MTGPLRTVRMLGGVSLPLRRSLRALVCAGVALVAPVAALTVPDAAAARRSRPAGQPLTLAWGGDVTLGSSYGNPPDAARGLLAAVAAPLRAADVGAVNLEGTLGSGGPSKCGGGSGSGGSCFAFQAPAVNVAGLRVAGVDVVNLANNHAFDFGASGQAQTLGALAGAGIAFTGRPGEVRVLRLPHARVAFVGFSAYPWSAPIGDLGAVRTLVRAAAARANVVVAFVHAGAEGSGQVHTPNHDEVAFGESRGNPRAFAHAAIDAGADLVVGSGPHVLRGIELDRGRLIAYSLGNLAGYRNFGIGPVTGTSALLTVRLGPDGTFMSGGLRSLRLSSAGVPAADPGGAAAHLVSSVSRADFGAHGVTVAGGRLIPHAGFRRAPPFARGEPRRPRVRRSPRG